MKKTAVDWLKDMLEWNYGDPKMLEISWVNLDDLFERAKEMEEGQIAVAYSTGTLDGVTQNFTNGYSYYEKTYKIK